MILELLTMNITNWTFEYLNRRTETLLCEVVISWRYVA